MLDAKRLQKYAYSIRFRLDNEKYLFQNSIISLLENEKQHHYAIYTNYELDKEAKNIVWYKELGLKLDRLYYLELANSTISDAERINVLFCIVGKRRFGASKNRLEFYIENSKLDLRPILKRADSFFSNPLKHNGNHIFYEKHEKSINSYEVFFIDGEGVRYAYMRQTNTTAARDIKKDFLVELDAMTQKRISESSFGDTKIDAIFARIGAIYYNSMIRCTTEVSEFDEENILELISKSKEGGSKQKRAERYRDMHDELFNSKNLQDRFFSLYKAVMSYLKEHEEQTLANSLAEELKRYAQAVQADEVLAEITIFLTSLAVLVEDGEITEVLGKSASFRDIFIACIENIGEWQNDIFFNTSLDKEDKACATLDMIENIKYVIENINLNKNIKLTTDLGACFEQKGYLSATEFLSDAEIDKDLLDELENDINDVYEAVDTINDDTLKHTYIFFYGYSKMLNTLFEFKDLGYALSALIEFMKNVDFKGFDASKRKHLYVLLSGLITDLQQWKESVFIKQEAQDVHYMDASFFTNIKQLEIILLGNDRGSGIEEIEFF